MAARPPPAKPLCVNGLGQPRKIWLTLPANPVSYPHALTPRLDLTVTVVGPGANGERTNPPSLRAGSLGVVWPSSRGGFLAALGRGRKETAPSVCYCCQRHLA